MPYYVLETAPGAAEPELLLVEAVTRQSAFQAAGVARYSIHTAKPAELIKGGFTATLLKGEDCGV
jgi:hypothetical protein